MLFRKIRERRDRNQYVVDALSYLVEKVKTMATKDDLDKATARLESVAADAGKKLDDNAATIKDGVTKLAAAAAKPEAMSQADLDSIVSRVNGVADGLSSHIAPVAEAASAISAAAPAAAPAATTEAPGPTAADHPDAQG